MYPRSLTGFMIPDLKMMEKRMYTYPGGALDKIFAQAADDLAQDEALVGRFRDLVREKVEVLLPDTANLTAEKVCKMAVEDSSGYDSAVRKETQARIKTFFQSPEGSVQLDTAIQAAIKKSLEGDMITEVVRQFLFHEIGDLARTAVANAVRSAKKKEERQQKKVAK